MKCLIQLLCLVFVLHYAHANEELDLIVYTPDPVVKPGHGLLFHCFLLNHSEQEVTAPNVMAHYRVYWTFVVSKGSSNEKIVETAGGVGFEGETLNIEPKGFAASTIAASWSFRAGEIAEAVVVVNYRAADGSRKVVKSNPVLVTCAGSNK